MSNPPLPELRPIFTEIPACTRYFYSTYGNGIAPGIATATGQIAVRNASGATDVTGLQVVLPNMRAVPAVIWYSPNSGATTSVYDGSIPSDRTVSTTTTGTGPTNSGFPTLVSGVGIGVADQIFAHLTANARL